VVRALPQKPWTLNKTAIVVGWIVILIGGLGTLGGAVWTFSAERAGALQRIEANTARSVRNEDRLQRQEVELSRIATDVAWIRRGLERAGVNGADE